MSDGERRARLARRHRLAPGTRALDAEAATRAMTVLHATEAPTVYLALWARTEGLTVPDVDRALYEERSLVKQLAMRRTLFVFPRDLLAAAWGSAAARLAGPHAVRLAKDVEAGGLAEDGAAWLEAARAATLTHLADGTERSASELREQVPELAGTLEMGVGRTWGGTVPVAPRVITQLGMEARLVRASNGGHWRTSRPRYTLMEMWLGDVPAPLGREEGYAELVRRWLATFGPGTAADVQWWLGGTAGAVRQALADVGAERVSLDGGDTGWVLPEDAAEEPEVPPWAALLPVLDPTVMGWKNRDFFLGPHGRQLFDTNGNAGTTAWWDGRVVGCWVQDVDGRVQVVLLEDVPPAGRTALDREAVRLTEWLRGHRVSTVYPSPAMKAARP